MAQDFPPFYVGQRVVAVKTHSQKAFKEGDVFVVKEIRASMCSCHGWEISVGINIPQDFDPDYTERVDCGVVFIDKTGRWFFNTSIFAPIQENFQSISLEKILEEETKLVSAN